MRSRSPGIPQEARGYPYGVLVRDTAAADEDPSLGGSDGAGGSVNGLMGSEALAKSDEAVVSGDDDTIDAALGESSDHVGQEVDHSLEV